MIDKGIRKLRSDGLIPFFRAIGWWSYRSTRHLLSRIHLKTDVGNTVGSPNDGILMYHGVGEPPNRGYYGNVSTKKFERDIKYIINNMEVVDLPSINKNNPRQQIAITFDDGLKSFYQNVYPILKKYNVPATVFVNPSFINDQNRDEIVARHKLNIDPNERIMLTDTEVKELVDDPLITIGNHTLTHKRLPEIKNKEQLRTEIVGSKEMLFERYGKSVDTFCYPNGAVDSRSEKIVKESHEISVTTQPYLLNQKELDNLPRIGGHLPHHILMWELSAMGDYLNRRLNI